MDIDKVRSDSENTHATATTVADRRSKLRTVMPWAALGIVLIILAGASIRHLKPEPAGPQQLTYFSYGMPVGLDEFSGLAISPDGRKVIYGTTRGAYIQSVDQPGATLIAGIEQNPRNICFSPDGRSIGYWSQSELKLKKMPLDGGAAVSLCDTGAMVLDVEWHDNNTILYSQVPDGIMRISPEGGTSHVLIPLDLNNFEEIGFPIAPQILPGGKTLLFTGIIDQNPIKGRVITQSLETGERKEVLEGVSAQYISTGHLVYALEEIPYFNLMAAPFDLDTLEATGDSVTVLKGISEVIISKSGTLVYLSQSGMNAAPEKTPAGIDRDGDEEERTGTLKLNIILNWFKELNRQVPVP